ncbi:MAG TPA: GGDEF domain-containing protein [Steroidobacteraceae bacterium]|jgi:diguanylate cyclase|nr:GGDEF domain-containing protein [Steroidobacteraceae bacterium]
MPDAWLAGMAIKPGLVHASPCVPETADWKQKYRASLLEREAEENRWREIERVLRRLIGRLCAASMGQDTQLDGELTALAAANRRNADAMELDRLAESLTTAVVAVDATSPVPQLGAPPASRAPPVAPSGRWHSTCAALAALLERLKAGESDQARHKNWIAELATTESDAGLAAIVARISDLVHERGESLMRERLQAAAVLSEVTKRLEEMSGYLTESHSANRNHFDDTQSLNETVLSHVRELTDEVSGATELGLLQSVVSQRLESVAKQVCDFRAREAKRLADYNGRAQHMRERIADLEREAQELHCKLDLEKHGARLDPLTGVANRKSFEERFAEEIARRAHGGAPPLVMLLWDIDSFKTINDSYGHRAGDRVLQTVAECFTAAFRASDLVARIGGEEFAVLLSGLTLAEALTVANEARTAVEGLRFHFRGKRVRVTVSCGITQLHQYDASETAFDRADAALYRAKNGGKNLCVAA